MVDQACAQYAGTRRLIVRVEVGRHVPFATLLRLDKYCHHGEELAKVGDFRYLTNFKGYTLYLSNTEFHQFFID
jgi:hypothetical protein